MLLAKTKLNTVVFLISKAFIYPNISYKDFVVIKIEISYRSNILMINKYVWFN